MKNDTSLILVVDDNPENTQFLGNLLIRQKYDIGVAQNGLEALKFVNERLPDLILLDVMMPEMDGFEFCTALKKNIKHSHIPVIFLTAKSETADIIKGFEVGGVDYVTKPFIAEELLARVKTHLEIKNLRHLIPVCANCKDIRDDEGLWKKMEEYFEENTNAQFSHGICEKCAKKLYDL